ncbi:hypothetical protein [Pontibacter amylolyticus]|uniref:Outer membrane protein beta-barrel domain-containing protein n=1 Tax=Pontibacter amylolyticus TaxID=1424080 RepID=A0ABQ1W8H4_9BACT|nr:hypothetical protein [Pontibacter amylolyticus]GGG19047.1 hypothetical protein GCM10011323_23980 [Pontibacter amylolyticus]
MRYLLLPFARTCIRLLPFLLLLLSFASFAQPAKQHLPTGAPEAGELLREMIAWQDSLQAIDYALQDSSRLHASLDSLRQLGEEGETLARRVDSLSQAVAGRSVLPEELKEVRGRLERQLQEGKEALATQFMPEELEQALRQLEEAGQKSVAVRLPQPTAVGPLPTSADELKAKAGQTALKAAGEPFTEPFDRLGQAKADFDKYKGRASKVESVKDMPKGLLGPNSLKGKHWVERVVVGSLWQAGKQEHFFLDLGPTLAWRFSERLSAGAGGQYRLHLSVKEKPFVGGSERVGGYSLFSDFQIKSGFFARLQYEYLSAPVKEIDPLTQEETLGRVWVPGLLVGLGKDYTLYKKLRGYALLQYNLLHEKSRTPYLHPLQARVGFFLFGSDIIK